MAGLPAPATISPLIKVSKFCDLDKSKQSRKNV